MKIKTVYRICKAYGFVRGININKLFGGTQNKIQFILSSNEYGTNRFYVVLYRNITYCGDKLTFVRIPLSRKTVVLWRVHNK